MEDCGTKLPIQNKNELKHDRFSITVAQSTFKYAHIFMFLFMLVSMGRIQAVLITLFILFQTNLVIMSFPHSR